MLMNEYIPDNWVVLKILQAKPIYKVLAGWSGGYTQGDSWRINSGIAIVEVDGDCFLFRGFSGSTYRCHKSRYGLRMNNVHIYDKLIKSGAVEMLSETSDWTKIKYS